MPYEVDRFTVWTGPLEDRPGALAERLKLLADAGLNLEFVSAGRDRAQTGMFLVHPVKGAAQVSAAKAAGLVESKELQVIRLVGSDRPGLGADISRVLGEKNISARSVTATAMGGQSAFYIVLDTKQDAIKAEKAYRKAKLDREEQVA